MTTVHPDDAYFLSPERYYFDGIAEKERDYMVMEIAARREQARKQKLAEALMEEVNSILYDGKSEGDRIDRGDLAIAASRLYAMGWRVQMAPDLIDDIERSYFGRGDSPTFPHRIAIGKYENGHCLGSVDVPAPLAKCIAELVASEHPYGYR